MGKRAAGNVEIAIPCRKFRQHYMSKRSGLLSYMA